MPLPLPLSLETAVISVWTIHLSGGVLPLFLKCVQSQLLLPSIVSSVLAPNIDSVVVCSPLARSMAYSMPWSRSPSWPGNTDVESPAPLLNLVRHPSSAPIQQHCSVPIAIQSQDRPSLLTCAIVYGAIHSTAIWPGIRHVVTNAIRSHRVHNRWYLLFSKPVIGTSRVDQVGNCADVATRRHC